MYFEIVNAKYIENYKIHLDFEDGCSGLVDFSDYINPNNVFKAFSNKKYFENYKIAYGTLTWGNNEIDIAPETLYKKATNKSISWK